MSQLEINYSYYFKSANNLVKINPKGLPHPDEFWAEEKVNLWRKTVRKAEKEEQLNFENTTDQPSDKLFIPFNSTNNIFKDSFGLKLEGWTKEDPF